MGIGSVIGAPFTVASTATRHLLDANVTFGSSSDRYNARDKYRRSYSDQQRLGAGVGTALGVALPVAAGAAWMQRGLTVPGLSNQAAAVTNGLAKADVRGLTPAVMQNVGRAAGLAALGLATAVGVKKTIEISKDDGHLGAAGAAVGVIGGAIGGAALGKNAGGRIAAVSGGLGALAGGIAGHFGGSRIKIGESQIGKEHAQEKNDDSYTVPFTDVEVDGGAGRAMSFARGAFNHFNEVGPATQGIAFGHQWGMRETVQNQYSNSERAGGMHGDLLAAGILGGGALAVASGLMGRSPLAAQGVSNIRAGGEIAGTMMRGGPITNMAHRMGDFGKVGMFGAAAAIAGVTGWKAYQNDKATFGGGAAAAIGVGTLAATVGTGAAIAKLAPFQQGTSGGARAASGMLVAAALIGVVSSARLPLQQFMNDARDAHAANKDIDPVVKYGATGIGAAAGGFGAFKGLSKLVPDGGLQLGRFHVPKGVVVAAGTALGGAAVGGMGLGLSATMPDAKTVGLSVAGGAAAGAALGGVARGLGVVPGIIGGAALGLSASSLLKQDTPGAPAETTPQGVAGTVGG